MFIRKFSNLLLHIRYNIIPHANFPALASHITNIQHYSTFRLRNYYSVLGVKPKATDEEIKEAYYSMSKKYHPDLNLGNKNAESKILEINEAFEVLGNKLEKEKYDNKMFPKVWEKQSFIYERKESSTPPSFIFRRTFREMSHSYGQFVKHRKGEIKRKHRHATQKMVFNKSQSTKACCKPNFNKR